MSDHSVAHSTFSLERTYQAAPARVFAAWAEPAAKANWFAGPNSEHRLDFRVGGREVARGANNDGNVLTFESTYHDIVPSARIVYSSTLSVRDRIATVSVTTVEISAAGDGSIPPLAREPRNRCRERQKAMCWSAVICRLRTSLSPTSTHPPPSTPRPASRR